MHGICCYALMLSPEQSTKLRLWQSYCLKNWTQKKKTGNVVWHCPEFLWWETKSDLCFPVVLWSGCFGAWLRHLTRREVDPRLWTDCKLYFFMFYFGRHYSSMLLVLMSLEKCFCSLFSSKVKNCLYCKKCKMVEFCCWGYHSRLRFFVFLCCRIWGK